MEAVSVARFHTITISYKRHSCTCWKVFDTNYFQTELAGRHALNRETFEASPDAHNLHQLCSSEATYLRKKLSISTHVLGISFLREGVRSLFTEPVLQGTIPPSFTERFRKKVFDIIPLDLFTQRKYSQLHERWEWKGPCGWWRWRCRADTLGRRNLFQLRWRREGSIETSRMDWKVSITGISTLDIIQCDEGAAMERIKVSDAIPRIISFSQGWRFSTLGRLASLCWGGCPVCLSVWPGKSVFLPEKY